MKTMSERIPEDERMTPAEFVMRAATEVPCVEIRYNAQEWIEADA